MGQNNCESDSQTKTDENWVEEEKEGFKVKVTTGL